MSPVSSHSSAQLTFSPPHSTPLHSDYQGTHCWNPLKPLRSQGDLLKLTDNFSCLVGHSQTSPLKDLTNQLPMPCPARYKGLEEYWVQTTVHTRVPSPMCGSLKTQCTPEYHSPRVVLCRHSAHRSALPHVWSSARDEMSVHDLSVGIWRPVCKPTCKQTNVSTWLIA